SCTFPLWTSQRYTTPSSPAAANVRPSGEKLSERIIWREAPSTRMRFVFSSQTWTVVSLPPLASKVPSAENVNASNSSLSLITPPGLWFGGGTAMLSVGNGTDSTARRNDAASEQCDGLRSSFMPKPHTWWAAITRQIVAELPTAVCVGILCVHQ